MTIHDNPGWLENTVVRPFLHTAGNQVKEQEPRKRSFTKEYSHAIQKCN